MSLELLSQLENKIQATLENIELLKMELDEEKQKNEALVLQQQELTQKNQQLQQDLNSWSDKVNGLVGLLNNEI
ncbi:cell division protein ZapB [Shewanella sp. SR43-4]|jgi:cell division protein ZapB|uniref:Cell division protein ZapB n=1 Tax=Shewanella vesiculosa TaxID=518738 RepID=A0ABV0FQV2_9GAMM|nr:MULTISPECIES: cell division protein ZapB [Shewanella]NCQ44747.1 cell division protein ZapB [Shewanella frigidimarina]MBB1317842.1 cell division protein ZapB [Shewanella sp. SR43-4]MBB1322413.1 cell division protein ZapB [Shewanella sp. SR43-8]MBB1389643.1 cell division protein ZapB [Shewanella sp. SG44-6]MBB1475898.1 cell division protein ZapB [Shewanella sp. SG41-3]|tara:strand:+ start:2398 stop:2619 length:222 start_codon:yes stop_codon:yes gene_type:complete